MNSVWQRDKSWNGRIVLTPLTDAVLEVLARRQPLSLHEEPVPEGYARTVTLGKWSDVSICFRGPAIDVAIRQWDGQTLHAERKILEYKTLPRTVKAAADRVCTDIAAALNPYVSTLLACRECCELTRPDRIEDGICDRCHRGHVLESKPGVATLILETVARLNQRLLEPLWEEPPNGRGILRVFHLAGITLQFGPLSVKVSTVAITWRDSHTPWPEGTGTWAVDYRTASSAVDILVDQVYSVLQHHLETCFVCDDCGRFFGPGQGGPTCWGCLERHGTVF